MENVRFTYGFWASTRWAAASAIAAVAAGLLTVAAYAFLIGVPRAKPSDEYVVAISCLAMVGFIVWSVKLTGWPVRLYLALLPTARINYAIAIAAELVFLFVHGLVLSQLCDSSSNFQTQGDDIRAAMNSPLAALFLFNTIILAPITEEVLFRGFLLPSWSRSWLGPIGAVAATSIVFAAMHISYNLCGMVAVGLAGCVYGWLRLRSGSLLPPILAHCMGNATAAIGFAVGS
jgi:membrane protease YdiL (CAAX protease family)